IPVDHLTVAAALETRDQLDQVGGREYLVELQRTTPVSTHAPHHARIVLKHATRRRLITEGIELVAAAWDGTPTDHHIAKLAAAAGGPPPGSTPPTALKFVDAAGHAHLVDQDQPGFLV